MSTFDEIWKKLESSKEYREELVAAYLKRSLPFQIRTLRNEREWSQQLLAANAKVTQGVVSRAEDPDYGNLTLNTILRMGAGLDLAFVGKFVSFTEFTREFITQSESNMRIPGFEEEARFLRDRQIAETPVPLTVTINQSDLVSVEPVTPYPKIMAGSSLRTEPKGFIKGRTKTTNNIVLWQDAA